MNRRAFLSLLSAGAAGLALDPERLLWRPGAKSYFLPAVAPVPEGWSLTTSGLLMPGDVITIDGRYAMNPITMKATPYLQQFVVTDRVSAGTVSVDEIHPKLTKGRRKAQVRPLWNMEGRMTA